MSGGGRDEICVSSNPQTETVNIILPIANCYPLKATKPNSAGTQSTNNLIFDNFWTWVVERITFATWCITFATTQG